MRTLTFTWSLKSFSWAHFHAYAKFAYIFTQCHTFCTVYGVTQVKLYHSCTSLHTVQSRVFFTSPVTPADTFSKPPADSRTCPLSIPPRDTLIPPQIRRGPAVVPTDTCLIPPRIRGGLTMSNDNVIMIDS